MCKDCGGICAVVDRMIEDYQRLMEASSKRRYFHPMEIEGNTSASETTKLAEFVEQAACVGMTPQELEDELGRRTGFAQSVEDWVREDNIPNGLVRKIILTNAERIVREYGAKPRLTLLEAA